MAQNKQFYSEQKSYGSKRADEIARSTSEWLAEQSRQRREQAIAASPRLQQYERDLRMRP